ncbi:MULTISPECIES: hypothetical protein [unclassified Gilliamella]|uniref:hypothetical protein n=1 Tax=unclassified Gilliamella TaxID=2685620 RepID=UPI0013213CA7|nr:MULTISPECIES: hypothetical protein [unclassified Gilliamella]MWN31037.1 hypothetical protein [Gilliamella sp. Pra-s60]MWP28398.1 hypothetical protein [Gilliamella sp. Pra-s54]
MKLVTKQIFQKKLNIYNLLIIFAVCYPLMIVSIFVCKWAYYHSWEYGFIFNYITYLFIGLAALIEAILFVLMLIKLFTEPNAHTLTSFLGLIIGETFCICWYYFIGYGFNLLEFGWDYFIAFLYVIAFPFSGCLAYGMLFIVKALRWLVCFVLKMNP